MTNDDSKNSNTALKYECYLCEYYSNNKNDYRRHCKTIKHSFNINNDFNDKKTLKNSFECLCGKTYKYKQGLSVHKKQCKYLENETNNTNAIIENEEEETIDYKAMLLQVMKENTEIKNLLVTQQKQIIDILPKLGNTTNNNIKQRFNINMFLNEKCKDALSISEFIDTLEISMKNLLTTKDKGLSEGVTNIIIDNMNKLSIYERPMHCTDKKRETLYVKNQEWEKDANKEHINKLLKGVELKQMKNINQWTEEHPNYETDDRLQTEYINLVRKCTSSIDACKEKVIKNVCDKVYLDDKDQDE